MEDLLAPLQAADRASRRRGRSRAHLRRALARAGGRHLKRFVVLCLCLLVALVAAGGCKRHDVVVHEEAGIDQGSAEAAGEFEAKGIDGWTDAQILAQGARYLADPAFRRRALLASLANPNNAYSRVRIGAYALVSKGWDQLPEWTPRALPLDDARFAAYRAQKTGELPPLWDGRRPETMAGWVALGREVFFRYPLRSEVFLEHALERPELAASVGLRHAPDGTWPGGVVFTDLEGRARVGITCALCHTNVEGTALVVGRAHRSFDYGKLRLAYHHDTGAPVDPELARRMAVWGAGRADVTEDEAEDPVAIPDLFGLRAQPALTQAGSILHVGPAALAIRQETQLLHSNHQKIRPPRELAWALAMFLYSIEPPEKRAANTAIAANSAHDEGKRLFSDGCASCHGNRVFSGPTVTAALVGTDPTFAQAGARGTGRYRPPALLRVADAAPYLHHGAVGSLEDLLSPARFSEEWVGPLGKGAVRGHEYGTALAADKRALLVAYLRTL